MDVDAIARAFDLDPELLTTPGPEAAAKAEREAFAEDLQEHIEQIEAELPQELLGD